MRRVIFIALCFLALNAHAKNELVAFERLKSLSGQWNGRSTKGWTDRNKVEVIAAGSVILMRGEDAHPNEVMATAIHMDGERLVLTHYCVARNQPRLVATDISDDGRRIVFTFLDGTGMASRDTGHMDKAVFELIDDDHYTTHWTWYSKGEERWMEKIERVRVKP
jgi:hypothetical protein